MLRSCRISLPTACYFALNSEQALSMAEALGWCQTPANNDGGRVKEPTLTKFLFRAAMLTALLA